MFKLNLSAQQLQVINAALGEIPYRIAAPVVFEINKQLQSAQEQKQQGATESLRSASRSADLSGA